MDDIHCSQVMDMLWSQKKRGRFCDVVLQTEEGGIPAHKCVLCANSVFFDSVLLCTSSETALQEFHLPGSSKALVDQVVDYMYCGKVHITQNTLEDLMTFAEKYCIPGLKSVCVEYVKDNINCSNWLAILKLTKSLGVTHLYGVLNDFIVNSAKDIIQFKSDEFVDIPAEEVKFMLTSRTETMISNRGEMQLFKLLIIWVCHSVADRSEHIADFLKDVEIGHLDFTETQRFLDRSSRIPKEIQENQEIASLLNVLKSNDTFKKSEEPVSLPKNDLADYSDESDDNTHLMPEIPSDDEEKPIEGTASSVTEPVEQVVTTTRNKRKSSNPKRLGVEEYTPAVSPMKRAKYQRVQKTRGRALTKVQAKKERKTSDGTGEKKKRRIVTTKRGKRQVPTRTKVKAERVEIKCPTCPETLYSQAGFKLHMKRHGRETPFACDLCEFKTKHYGMFVAHKNRVHRDGRRMLQCPKCPKSFLSESKLAHHIRGHGSETPLLCDVCGFTTRHFASMNLHKRVHIGRVFKCEYEGCTYQAVRKHRYLDHLNKHTGVRNYVCPTCGKAFGAKKHLFRHENIHKEGKNVTCPPGGKVFKCEYEGCTYEAVRKNRYLDHLNKHTGMKNYICSTCGKGFGARKHLFRHENIHKVGKLLLCELCDYSNCRNDKLRLHIKRKHPNLAVEKGFITAAECAERLAALAAAPPPRQPSTKPKKSKKKAVEKKEGGEQETSRAAQSITKPAADRPPPAEFVPPPSCAATSAVAAATASIAAATAAAVMSTSHSHSHPHPHPHPHPHAHPHSHSHPQQPPMPPMMGCPPGGMPVNIGGVATTINEDMLHYLSTMPPGGQHAWPYQGPHV